MKVNEGDQFVWGKRFTEEDILQFAELTGDKGRHHMECDESGKLMVHGLLTASIGTKIAGDLNYIGSMLYTEYFRPVFSGDTIECELNIIKVEELEGIQKVSLESVYKNQKGKIVMQAKSEGIIRN
ncbi:enoyl-CoA hydratase [Bacillus carboniphilus]|uniref:Enoyl-CoA hydratase n=1 Tax=Bacillus carboniphilus TaxID=86663 RepID=A0ABY9JSN4_9BACI|nr:enoyl-CoA hydratase [Bacillus carboniphilus]WLR42411.1 enoyl-CoA hydratase [Bacillus carboniphilus]